MKRNILKATLAFLCILFVGNITADNVVDVVTLKNNSGVIKGFINEQIPGEIIKISPVEALLKLNYDTIIGISTKKKDPKDTTGIDLDIVTLKGGTTIEGTIIEQSPGKWISIKTKSIIPLTYRYDEIEKIGKETVDINTDIFKAYGVLDVITTKNGTESIKGIITEQTIGKTLKIKTIDRGTIVLDVADIQTIGKEAYDSKKDIFRQSAFLDVVYLKSGTSIKGIVVLQKPGQDIKIEAYGSSVFVEKLSDISRFSKEINPYRVKDTVIISILEPTYIGECYIIAEKDNIKVAEKQEFIKGARTQSVLLLNGSAKSTSRFIQNQEIALRVRVNNNNLNPAEQIHIFKIGIDKKTNKRYINTLEHLILSPIANRESKPSYLKFDAIKSGKNSFDIKFKVTEPGEYAIHVDGCNKSFSLFGVDFAKK
jgi:hypothetical protein